jgi:hypothetical protein
MTEHALDYRRHDAVGPIRSPSLMLGAIISAAISLIYPNGFLIAASAFVVFTVVYARPMIGIYLLTIVQSIQCIHLSVDAGTYRSINFYLSDALSIVLLFVLLLRYLNDRNSRKDEYLSKDALNGWIVYFFAVLAVWTTLTIFWNGDVTRNLLAWYRLNKNLIIVSFIVCFLTRYSDFVKVIKLFCFITVIFGIAGIYASYNYFSQSYLVYENSFTTMWLDIFLFNTPSGSLSEVEAMLSGYGLCGKHELGMLLIIGTIFGLFLIREYKSKWTKAALVLLILYFESVLYLGVNKVTVAGSLGMLGGMCILFPSWRRWTAVILAAFILLNVVGAGVGNWLKPGHMKTNESTEMRFKKGVSKSEYQDGSFALRKRYWRQTIRVIVRNQGVGMGGDGTQWDPILTPHGHNMFLTGAAEYGAPYSVILLVILFLVGKLTFRRLTEGSAEGTAVWSLQLTIAAGAFCTVWEYMFDCFIWWPHLWYMTGILLASLRLPRYTYDRCNEPKIRAATCTQLETGLSA